jgi:hypothetical protein
VLRIYGEDMSTDFIDYPHIPDSAVHTKKCVTCQHAFFHNKWMCDFPYKEEKYCKLNSKHYWKKRHSKLDTMFQPEFITEEEMIL